MSSPAAVNKEDPFGRREGPPRKEVVAGSVSEEEKGEILIALAAQKFEHMSEGVRTVMLAYARSPEIRVLVEPHREAA